jgi:hypothetical protein
LKKALFYVAAVLIAGLVGAGLNRLLPGEVLGFSKVVIYGPVIGFIVGLGIYSIVSPGKPFKKHFSRAMVGLGIGVVVAIAIDKLL